MVLTSIVVGSALIGIGLLIRKRRKSKNPIKEKIKRDGYIDIEEYKELVTKQMRGLSEKS